jgi:hypothetical protein
MASLPTLRLEGLAVYRRILKLHNTLPRDFRILANAYVRDEFQKHHFPTIPLFSSNHYFTFLNSWRQYLRDMQKPDVRLFGKALTPQDLRSMSRDQRLKLTDVKSVFTGDDTNVL